MFLSTYHMPGSELSSAETRNTWFNEFEVVVGKGPFFKIEVKLVYNII